MSDELTDSERRKLDAWAPMAPPAGFSDRVLSARMPIAPSSSSRRWLWLGGLTFGAAAAIAIVLVIINIAPKPTPLAVITKADGPIERQEGTTAWELAKVGVGLFLGDAARTADMGAELLVANSAKLSMQPHTVLRFGGTVGQTKISVEIGAIDLSGTGTYALAMGDVRLRNGTVRITADNIELVMGEAKVVTPTQQIELVIGQAVDYDMVAIAVISLDAGVPEVVVDAAVPSADGATIAVIGKKAEFIVPVPGQTKWTPLPAGAGILPAGAKVRLGAATTAKITARGTTLDMASGARMALDDNFGFTLEAGAARGINGKFALPGGAIGVNGTEAEARLDVSARDTKVTVLRGNAKLAGATGGELEMKRGETATLAKNGTIRILEAIPNYFDFRVATGESVTIHDPKGNTAVQFSFSGKCPEGGFVEMDKNQRFQTAKVSAGKQVANLMVGPGGWAYRLRCSTKGVDSAAVGAGRIVVIRDSGTRRLPTTPATNNIDADGRNYRISYQSVIPTVSVSTKGTGSTFKLHVATGGKEQVFEGKGARIRVPGNKLDEGQYTYWLERDGVRDPKVSTLTIDFDNTAPQVYIQEPGEGTAWPESIPVRGAVLPGWTAAIDSVVIPIDKQRRFSASVPKPAGKALAIKLSHPQRGVHYYLRRGK